MAGNDIEVSDPSKLLEETTRAENSYHVVTGSGTDNTAILDGLIITAGNANSSEIVLYRGGGIYIYKSGSPTLIRCNFKCNSGKSGGAIYISEGSPMLYSCVFQDNGAYNGAGIHHNRSSLTLDNCTFIGNASNEASAAGLYCRADYENIITLSNCRFIQNVGSGIKFYDSPNFELVDCNFIENIGSGIEISGYIDPWRAIIKRCIFVRNSHPKLRGGGIDCHGYNGLEITECEFEENNAIEGGGIYLSGGNLDTFTFVNCTLRGNSSKLRVGGGMYVRGGNPVIVNSTFCQNTADNYGGGLYLKYVEQAKIERCVFIDNSSGYGGGGIGIDGYSSSLLSQCVFENNKAETYGGGIYNSDDCNVIINKCIFNCNSAGSGGGAIFNKGDNVTPTYDCLFTNNKADLGGAILNSNDCNYLINSCRFNGNLANNNGGGIYNRARSSPTLLNCEFSGNIARNQGGAIHSSYQCNAIVKNCSLNGNKAYEGGVIFVQRETDITILNCIFRDNSAIKGSNLYLALYIWDKLYGSSVSVSYCDIQDGQASAHVDPNCILKWHQGNIDANPCFVEPGYWDPNGTPEDANDDFWIDGDYHLLPESPCIDAGDPNYVAEPNDTDLDGRPRLINGRIDMGAYEYRPPILAYVRIIPRTISLASSGKWIGALLRLPEDYNVIDIDPNSVLLENEIEPERFWLSEDKQIAMAKFDREQVQNILSVGKIELTITGHLIDGQLFEGKDIIRVLNRVGGKSAKK